MTPVSKVLQYLVHHKERIASEIVDAVLTKMELEIPDWERNNAIAMYEEFICFLADYIEGEKQMMPEDVLVWSRGNGEHTASSGEGISKILIRYPPTRTVLTALFTKTAVAHKLSVEETVLIINQANMMLDMSMTETVLAFESSNNKLLQDNQKEMARLSAPIVPLKDRVAILPLIGKMDAYRMDYVVNKVLPKISSLELDFLIVDFSGILTINNEVAEYLDTIDSVLQLIGVKTVMTGLRPNLVQTIVQGGLDLKTIAAFAHVKQALEEIEQNKL